MNQYRASESDRNIWIRPAIKERGFKHYEMCLFYVDDVLVVS